MGSAMNHVSSIPAGPFGVGYAVETITTIEGLRALEAPWHDLARALPSPLVQFEWFMSAAEAFGDRLHVVAVRRGQALHAVAPLALSRRGGISQLEVLGHQLGEPQRLVVRDDPALPVLVDALCRTPFALTLRKIAADGLERATFDRSGGRGLKLVTGAESRASSVPLHGGVEARVSGKRRQSLRKGLRLAQAQGPVAFRFLYPRADELGPLLDEVFRIEASGWKARMGTALAQDARLGTFFCLYAKRLAELRCLRLGFMTIGEATAAVRLEAEWGGCSWDLKVGYDERFAHASPGLLLCHQALLHGAERGLEAHHFLGEHEAWHACWDAELAPQITLRHYGWSVHAGAALAGDVAGRLRAAVGGLRMPRRAAAGALGAVGAVQCLPVPI